MGRRAGCEPHERKAMQSEYTIEVGGLRVQSDGPLRELEWELMEESGAWRVYDNRTGAVVASSRTIAWNEGSTEA